MCVWGKGSLLPLSPAEYRSICISLSSIPVRFINCQWFLCICQKMYPGLLWEGIYTVLSLLMLTLAEGLLFCAKMLGELLRGPKQPFLEANCSFKASAAASPPCLWPLKPKNKPDWLVHSRFHWKWLLVKMLRISLLILIPPFSTCMPGLVPSDCDSFFPKPLTHSAHLFSYVTF